MDQYDVSDVLHYKRVHLCPKEMAMCDLVKLTGETVPSDKRPLKVIDRKYNNPDCGPKPFRNCVSQDLATPKDHLD